MKSVAYAFAIGAVLCVFASHALAQTPLAVKLDLYDGDKYSHKFSEGVRAALAGDGRFQLVDKLPPDGLKISMDDAISYDADNGAESAGYKLSLKLGSGKFIGHTTGYCDVGNFDMCGRVAVEDAYEAYTDHVAKP